VVTSFSLVKDISEVILCVVEKFVMQRGALS